MGVDVSNYDDSMIVIGGSQYDDANIGYELAKVISIASVIEELEGRDEEVDGLINAYLTKWITLVSPIEYVPGMIEAIASKINKRLSKVIGDVSEEELGEVLSEVVRVKRELEGGGFVSNWMSLEVKISKILRCLGIDLNEIRNFYEVGDSLKRIYRLVSIFVIAIGISSIWDEKWIVGYQ